MIKIAIRDTRIDGPGYMIRLYQPPQASTAIAHGILGIARYNEGVTWQLQSLDDAFRPRLDVVDRWAWSRPR
jgi:hypothetical protein